MQICTVICESDLQLYEPIACPPLRYEPLFPITGSTLKDYVSICCRIRHRGEHNLQLLKSVVARRPARRPTKPTLAVNSGAAVGVDFMVVSAAG
jgi:hypothetical protein